LFCRRAWWYRAQGLASLNQAELAGGTNFHQRHGRQVVRAGMLRAAGWVLLALAILSLLVGITLQFLG
jgi:hypothetical protein